MKKYILILTGALLLFSCRDYLDVVPKGYIIPNSVAEYELLLIGGDRGPNITDNATLLHFSNDNFYFAAQEIGNSNNNLNNNYALYAWNDNRYADPTVACSAWNDSYRNIYTFNKIIEEIDGAPLAAGDTEQLRARVKAQAYYGRAYEYLFLVNIFSKQYKESTAGTDLGVPLVLKADVTQTLPSRGTVAEVYTQILADLNIAVANLPESTNILSLPNLGAGYALLARTSIYKNDYENAKKYSALALGKNSTLFDYTQPDFTNGTLSLKTSEQYAVHFMSLPGNGFLSESAKDLFPQVEGDDKRLSEQFMEREVIENGQVTGYRYVMGTNDYRYKGTTSVSIGEMYVTQAEAEARLGNNGVAVNLLNTLREKRISDYTPVSEADFPTQNDLVKFCLEERRREMIYTNTRLFDLKRENLEPAFAKVTIHKVLGTTILTFTAEPNSGKLVLPIPAQVLKFNPSMPQN